MSRLEILEQSTHQRAHAPRVVNQFVFLVDSDRRDCGSAGKRMTVVSKAAVENILLKMISDLPSHTNCAQRDISARQTLRHRHQIRHDLPMIDREPFTRATKARHHFISDQQDAVLVAKIAQPLHVAVRRDEYAVSPGNWFDDQCSDGLWSFELENFFGAREHVFRRVPTFLNAMIEIGNAEDARNSRFGGPPAWIARESQRSRRAAVITAISRADLVASGVKS